MLLCNGSGKGDGSSNGNGGGSGSGNRDGSGSGSGKANALTNANANANALANPVDAPAWTLSGMLVPDTVLPEWPRPVSGELPTRWRAVHGAASGGVGPVRCWSRWPRLSLSARCVYGGTMAIVNERRNGTLGAIVPSPPEPGSALVRPRAALRT